MARTPRAPRIKLVITNEMIEDAIPRDSSHCLWAESVKVAVPDARHVSVDLQTIRFSNPVKGLRYTYLTPRIAQIALVQFDQGIRPEPQEVLLRNGQVTAAGRRMPTSKPLSEAQLKQRQVAYKKSGLAKAKLHSETSSGTVPAKVGGKTPPIAAGKRRAFGLRGMEF